MSTLAALLRAAAFVRVPPVASISLVRQKCLSHCRSGVAPHQLSIETLGLCSDAASENWNLQFPMNMRVTNVPSGINRSA